MNEAEVVSRMLSALHQDKHLRPLGMVCIQVSIIADREAFRLVNAGFCECSVNAQLRQRIFTDDVRDWFRAQRRAMYDPARGTWFVAVLEVDAERREYRFTFDYESQPVDALGLNPSLGLHHDPIEVRDMVVRECERLPRPAEMMPPWMSEALSATTEEPPPLRMRRRLEQLLSCLPPDTYVRVTLDQRRAMISPTQMDLSSDYFEMLRSELLRTRDAWFDEERVECGWIWDDCFLEKIILDLRPSGVDNCNVAVKWEPVPISPAAPPPTPAEIMEEAERFAERSEEDLVRDGFDGWPDYDTRQKSRTPASTREIALLDEAFRSAGWTTDLYFSKDEDGGETDQLDVNVSPDGQSSSLAIILGPEAAWFTTEWYDEETPKTDLKAILLARRWFLSHGWHLCREESEQILAAADALMSPAVSSGVVPDGEEGPLAGEIVVVTGAVPGMLRGAALAAVESLGGVPSPSLSKKTTLLVAGEGTGSKVDKARQLGIRIMPAAEFVALFHARRGTSE